MYSKPFERHPQVADLTTTRTNLSYQEKVILARLADKETPNFREGQASVNDPSVKLTSLLDDYQVFTYDSLHQVCDRWKALQENALAYAYQRMEWAMSWIETVGTPNGYSIHIVELRDSWGETAVIVPLCWKKVGTVHVAHFIGEDMFDYLSPLVRRDLLTDMSKNQIAEFWHYVTTSFPVKIDLFWLDRVPGKASSFLMAFKPFSMTPLDNHAHAMDFPVASDWPSAARKLRSKKTIKKLEYRMRALAKHGELKLIEVTENAERHKHLATLIDLKVSNLNDAGTLHRFDRDDIRDFYSSLINNTANDEDLLQFELRCDGELVASVLGMSHQGTFYYQVCAHNLAFAKFSPGQLLMYQLMSWSFDRGLKCFDMTIGDEAYKKDWINRSTSLQTVSWPTTVAGKLLLAKKSLLLTTKGLIRKSDLLTQVVMVLLKN